MTTHLDTRLEIKSWDEKPYRESADGQKFTTANVALSVAEDRIEAEGTWDAVLYYAADGTSGYAGVMQLVGRIDGRTGSVVLQGTGTYDGTSARGEFVVVPGSGTGELRGLRGTSTSVSTHEDYPYMPLTLDYEVE